MSANEMKDGLGNTKIGKKERTKGGHDTVTENGFETPSHASWWIFIGYRDQPEQLLYSKEHFLLKLRQMFSYF